ncbi:DUF3631 domain-containing protein [Paucibacter sp. B2R-40]|uniref:DUF3631 domain-containing protein n=1 Tax=Paucibacter sp. B2R-40 TaxID=2893554 RepID=UPI0021E3D677|nr:DUF3631 domain-containing protein [Paucibacter sp. B2R-40]MCV2352621.1 DUF3631 domain-containing protein [Paucibacter sp. B2R-40]
MFRKDESHIALEKHLPDSTMSRGIVFGMRRKMTHEKVKRFRHADTSDFNRLASQLARFALDHASDIKVAHQYLQESGHD